MKIKEILLYRISKAYPDFMSSKRMSLGGDVASDEYHVNYALKQQFDRKVKQGIKYDIRGKEILEIGCGHGGISVFLAVNGAKRVLGIDLNIRDMDYARMFQKKIENELNLSTPLPIEFVEMNAYQMEIPPKSFDIVMADNVFEHFMEPQKVMEQSHKVLRKGGKLIIPLFSSIYSKHALHLKNGLKVPWANLFFSEKTIVNVMKKICEENPSLFEIYPGVLENPTKVRDLRRYKDLNDITYSKFKQMAKETGYEIELFNPKYTPVILGKTNAKIPLLRNSLLADIFSEGAEAVLTKI